MRKRFGGTALSTFGTVPTTSKPRGSRNGALLVRPFNIDEADASPDHMQRLSRAARQVETSPGPGGWPVVVHADDDRMPAIADAQDLAGFVGPARRGQAA